MTTVKSTYQGNLRVVSEHVASGATIHTDAPIDNHGTGDGFSPTDLFCTSLASCMLTIMGISANSYGFELKGATAEVQKVMAASPRRVAEIIIDLHFPDGASYGEREKRLIESAAHTCPVANSLSPDVIKTIRFHY